VIALDQIGSLEKAVNDFALADQAALAKQDREPYLKLPTPAANLKIMARVPKTRAQVITIWCTSAKT
jgi:hypothetical protein